MQTCNTQDPQGHNEWLQRSSCKLLRAQAVWFYEPLTEEDVPPTWKPFRRINHEYYDGEGQTLTGTLIEFPSDWRVFIN